MTCEIDKFVVASQPALWALYICICADVWIGAYTDPNTSEELTLQMVAFWYCTITLSNPEY
jgi:hypothetical protein